MMRKSLVLVFTILLTYQSFAQSIQWASSVDFVYNQFSNQEYSALEAVGKPDAAPYGALNHQALRLNAENTFGTIVVNYDQPQVIKNVVIVESYLPGRIVNIILYDQTGSRSQVYRQEARALDESCRVFILTLPENAYDVSRVEVNLDTKIHSGWSQIDAIGISGDNLATVREEIKSIGISSVAEEMSYGNNRINLGQNVNSRYNETRPVISPDGQILYFSRQNHPDNINGEADPQDIYYSEWQSGGWSPAKNIGAPLNDENANGINSVGADGKSLLLINEYANDGIPQTGISVAYLSESGWSFPKKMMIDDYYNFSPYADFFMSPDGQALIMAIEREDSYGDQDLYISRRNRDNSWNAPVNLGNSINSPGPEFAPFLSADGTTLYFSSEGHGGYGSSDIFFTDRLDDSWLNWSSPKNMGSMVNSPYWDAYYSITNNSDHAYFVSTKGSQGASKDIFKIQLPKKVKPNPVMLIAGQIYDQQTGKPVEGAVELYPIEDKDKHFNTQSDPKDGLYKVTVPTGGKYRLVSHAKGYIVYDEEIELESTGEDEYMDKAIALQPIEVGNTLVMQKINFIQSEAILLSESYDDLEKLLQMMKENPHLVIELGGHTDGSGSYQLNMELSEERVKVVKDYLVENGVSEERMEVKAYGSTKPLASNASESTRRLNRRVEVKIIKNN